MTTQITDNGQRYGFVTRALHWGSAGLLAALAVLGWVSEDLPKAVQADLMGAHISLGIGFLVLVGARIAWRVWQGWPEFHETGSRLLQRMARWMHLALFGFMILLPVTGWVIVSAAGQDASFFGLFSLPQMVPESHFIEDGAEEVHETLVSVMLFLVGVHVLAVFKHKYFDRDRVVNRMIG